MSLYVFLGIPEPDAKVKCHDNFEIIMAFAEKNDIATVFKFVIEKCFTGLKIILYKCNEDEF